MGKALVELQLIARALRGRGVVGNGRCVVGTRLLGRDAIPQLWHFKQPCLIISKIIRIVGLTTWASGQYTSLVRDVRGFNSRAKLLSEYP